MDVEKERQRNQEAYERLREKLEESYRGRFVAIAEGKLIADASTLEEVLRKAKEAAPDAKHRIIFKVGEEYLQEVTIGI